jgi:putative ribosome biogenesis GTPase RsgA
MLTKTEMNRLATLMSKASSEDMRTIARMYNDASAAKTRSAARSFSVGDKVKWSGKNGTQSGIVKKVNRKNIVVVTEFNGTWNVTASLLKKAA